MFLKFLEILVWDYLWGVPLVVVVLGAGIWFTVTSGFFQFRHLGYSLKQAIDKLFEKNNVENGDGVISPLEAMSIAIGTTVGVGNIGGVSTAIAIGGPRSNILDVGSRVFRSNYKNGRNNISSTL